LDQAENQRSNPKMPKPGWDGGSKLLEKQKKKGRTTEGGWRSKDVERPHGEEPTSGQQISVQ